MINVTGAEQGVLTFAGLVLPALGGWIAYRIDQHCKIANDSTAATRVATGVNAMAQIALGELTSIAAHNPTIDIKNAAVARAIGQASAGFSTAAKAVGLTPETLAARVSGALAEKMTPTPVAGSAPEPATKA